MKKIEYYSVRQSSKTLSLLSFRNFERLEDARNYVQSVLEQTIKKRQSEGSKDEFSINQIANRFNASLHQTFQLVSKSSRGWICVENVFIERTRLIIREKNEVEV